MYEQAKRYIEKLEIHPREDVAINEALGHQFPYLGVDEIEYLTFCLEQDLEAEEREFESLGIQTNYRQRYDIIENNNTERKN